MLVVLAGVPTVRRERHRDCSIVCQRRHYHQRRRLQQRACCECFADAVASHLCPASHTTLPLPCCHEICGVRAFYDVAHSGHRTKTLSSRSIWRHPTCCLQLATSTPPVVATPMSPPSATATSCECAALWHGMLLYVCLAAAAQAAGLYIPVLGQCDCVSLCVRAAWRAVSRWWMAPRAARQCGEVRHALRALLLCVASSGCWRCRLLAIAGAAFCCRSPVKRACQSRCCSLYCRLFALQVMTAGHDDSRVS